MYPTNPVGEKLVNLTFIFDDPEEKFVAAWFFEIIFIDATNVF